MQCHKAPSNITFGIHPFTFICEKWKFFLIGGLFIFFWRIFSRFPERIYHVKLSFVIPAVPLAGHPDWAPDRTLLFIINQRFFAVHSTQLFVFSSFFNSVVLLLLDLIKIFSSKRENTFMKKYLVLTLFCSFVFSALFAVHSTHLFVFSSFF